MRRGIGFTLICLGLFLAVLGGAIRFWAQDRLVVVPINLYSTTELTGRGTYLDLGTTTTKTATVVTRQTIRADVEASSDRVLVVDLSQVISTADGQLIRASVERAALDRRSGAAVKCCGESLEGKPADHQGYLFKLPFNTPRRAVLMWDSTAADAYPAEYQGVDTIAGHQVYKFVTTTPAHQIRTQAESGLLVGEAKTWDVPVWNQSTKTLWVEPVTGIPLAVKVDTKTTLRNSRNEDKKTVFAASMHTDKANPNAETLALVESSRRRIQLVAKLPPLQLGIGGLLASLGAGLLLGRRRPARLTRPAPVSPAPPLTPPAPRPARRPAGGPLWTAPRPPRAEESIGAHRMPDEHSGPNRPPPGSYRRRTEENTDSAADWFSQIRPEGHGRHPRLDPDDWFPRYDALPPVAPPPRRDDPPR